MASLEVHFPANTFLEAGATLLLRAVARNAAGDSVAADIRWQTPDTTVILEPTGLVTAVGESGTARIQAGVFGADTIVSSLAGLTLTITRRADSLVLTSADSLTIARDTLDTASIRVTLLGGDPPTGVSGRPVALRIVDPVPVDSPGVVFNSGRTRDSVMTGVGGIATSTVRGVKGRAIPDRAVVEVHAYRADGTPIPGSGRTIVIRFLHQ